MGKKKADKEYQEKRITFRARGSLLEKLLKEKDASKVIRAVLTAHYGDKDNKTPL